MQEQKRPTCSANEVPVTTEATECVYDSEPLNRTLFDAPLYEHATAQEQGRRKLIDSCRFNVVLMPTRIRRFDQLLLSNVSLCGIHQKHVHVEFIRVQIQCSIEHVRQIRHIRGTTRVVRSDETEGVVTSRPVHCFETWQPNGSRVVSTHVVGPWRPIPF